MPNIDFTHWGRDATAKIKYPPERRAVERELRQHLEDRYDGLIAKGLSHDEANQQTLAAMGSAKELAPLLAEIHKPHWGYAVIALKWVMVALLLIVCIIGNRANDHTITDSAFTTTESGEFSRIRLLEPNISFQCDSYRLTVQKAALWESTQKTNHHTNTTTTLYTLRLQIRVTQPPFHPQFNAWEYFWAEDSQGNRYVADIQAAASSSDWGQTHFAGMESRIFYDAGYLSISSIPSPDIKWMDLHFDLDGRDITVRIDLTGGDSA